MRFVLLILLVTPAIWADSNALSDKTNFDFPNGVPEPILQNLSPGIFYMGLYTRQDFYDWSNQHWHKAITDSDLEFLDSVGFRSIRLMFSLEPILFPECVGGRSSQSLKCAQNLIKQGRLAEFSNQGSDLNYLSKKRYAQLLSHVRRLVKNSSQYIVIVPSGRQRDGKQNGEYWAEATTVLSVEMQRKTESAESAFTHLWQMLATDLADIPSERLGFELYNEPEFCYDNARILEPDMWKGIATKTVDLVRSVAPNHTIFVSGICKGLGLRRNKEGGFKYPITQMGIPIERDNIVYVFHAYPDKKYSNQDFSELTRNGEPFVKPNRVKLEQFKGGASRINSWRQLHEVPVWLNEFGANIPTKKYKYFEEAVNARAKWARSIVSDLEAFNIPYSWSKFGLSRRPFLNSFREYGVEKKRVPDCQLLKSLRVDCAVAYVATETTDKHLKNLKSEVNSIEPKTKMICTNALGAWTQQKTNNKWIKKAEDLGLDEQQCRAMIRR